MSWPGHPPWLHHPHNIWWRVGLQYFIICLFKDASNISLNDRMISEEWIGKDVEGRGRGQFNELSWHLSGGLENWGRPRKTSVRISGLRADILPRTFRIRSRSANHSIATFSVKRANSETILIMQLSPDYHYFLPLSYKYSRRSFIRNARDLTSSG
jgi:hypothetical protein